MENHEVKGVSNASEIKKAYTEAVANNYKYYRAVSKTNQIYGWNENTNNFVKAQAGQEWFDNPHYVEPIVEEKVEEPIEEEPIVEEMVEVANEMVEEVKAEETVEKAVEEVDYKALYEQAQQSIKELIDENGKLKEEINSLEEELDKYEEVVENYKTAHEALLNL